jgi:hypothetical protein
LSIVNKIKNQYARNLVKKDAKHFKEMAEYYLETAARLKKKDIRSSKNKLLLRNSQKRLFLGVGCELLLKAYYLEKGYCINKFTKGFEGKKSPIHKMSDLNIEHVNPNDTFTMGQLIDSLKGIGGFNNFNEVKRGFKIAMTFRNKEGHVSFPAHEFDESNYRDIENAVIAFYSNGFKKKLKFKISMKPNDRAVFKIST